ncbi:MAG: hypothetical protein GKR89_04440 [Candidatus Latescibacteria bacterium]|nr:hypothetical protein [Candidatus Latescibacterota bacterium]
MNWNLDSYFPQFDGPQMRQFKSALAADMAVLGQEAAELAPLAKDTVAVWEAVFVRYEDILARLSHLGSYIGCLTAADARNEVYAREEGALARLEAENAKIDVELQRACKGADDIVFDDLASRPTLAGGGHFLRRLRQQARYTMDPSGEVLAADLGVDGIGAWGRLYSTVAAKLEFSMQYPNGDTESLPMAQRRSLMQHPDRAVRQAAFNGGNEAWAGMEDVAGAALNAIGGTRLSLNAHRGVDHFLDVALFQAAIGRPTLEALFAAIWDRLELPRRMLALKARSMGRSGVAWYDLEAPLPLKSQDTLDWEQAKRMVADSFRAAYPLLGQFVQETYAKDWIEWEPRPGKRPGAFCTGSLLTRESRIFMTYNQSLGGVQTLAHEVGHAFHSYIMRDLRPYARLYPMTLAEAASTFAEMVLAEGILADPSVKPRQKAAILDMEIGHGAAFLLDIPVRYEFEKAFYEERANGEVGVTRLRELMAENQRRLFGPVLEEGGEDPYFWASKLHFYITGVTFYNFPYTFGFLLSRGLFAQFKKEGPDFLGRYEDFLRYTGSGTAEEVARQTIGCDLEATDFWIQAIDTLEAPLDQLEALLPQVLPGV